MRVVETYSHLNGLEFLQVHKPNLWSEIVTTIESVDAETLRTKESKETRKNFKMVFSPKELNAAFKDSLVAQGWESQTVGYYVTADQALARATLALEMNEQRTMIEAEGKQALYSFNQTDFVKDRLAIEVQFGKYSFVAYDLFVKHMAFYSMNKIDCGIEILPMKSMQNEMSSGPSYYEKEIYNVIRQGRGVPAVPLVVVGVDA